MSRPRHHHLGKQGQLGKHPWLSMTALTVAAALASGAVLLVAGAMVATSSITSAGYTPTALTAPSASAGSAPAPTSAGTPIPVYAYFYQGFNAMSWDHAKLDLPLAGPYNSDDPQVLRNQVGQAKSAGIDGFLTSWKSTDTLDRRLDLLVHAAQSQNFDLGVVYGALDFLKQPLPVETVKHDMVYLVQRWASLLTSRYYGRLVIIWTGTDQYSTAEVRAVKAALGNRVYLLATAHNVSGYERVAKIVDGESYYWPSADPTSSTTIAKLAALSQAVHDHHGLWVAPAASGYNGSALGGTRVIGRDNGRTLVTAMDNAYASTPDAVAVISWNEWSENTSIEPGRKYGDRELQALRAYLRARGEAIPTGLNLADSSEGDSLSGWTGARAAVTLAMMTIVTVLFVSLREPLRARRRRTQQPTAKPVGWSTLASGASRSPAARGQHLIRPPPSATHSADRDETPS